MDPARSAAPSFANKVILWLDSSLGGVYALRKWPVNLAEDAADRLLRLLPCTHGVNWLGVNQARL
jgi:hypothetical protein